MPRWLRVVRGMIGTGLTFAAGVGVVASVAGIAAWLGRGITGDELLQIVGRVSVAGFLLGVGFSGVLAATAGGRRFNRLSFRLTGALGTGAGLLYFGVIAVNGARSWSAADALANLVILTIMGAGSATATLMIARKAGSSLESGEESASTRRRIEPAKVA